MITVGISKQEGIIVGVSPQSGTFAPYVWELPCIGIYGDESSKP